MNGYKTGPENAKTQHPEQADSEFYGRPEPWEQYTGQAPYQQEPPFSDPQAPYPYGIQRSADNTRLYSILSYISILWLVGLFADRGNPRVRFHVNQGIILTITQIALSFAEGLFSNLVSVIFARNYSGVWTVAPLGSMLSSIVSFAVSLSVLALIIIGIVRAAQGREEPLPVIGNLFTILR